MNETVLYRERLPKYVFKGSRLKRKSIQVAQLTDRIVAFVILAGTIYLAVAPKTDNDHELVWVGIVLGWIACATLLYSSEHQRRPELDGSVPTIICIDRISIPPRIHRKLTRKPNSVRKEEVDHITILCGEAAQYISHENGSIDRIVWTDSPISLIVSLRSGRKVRLGYKPPSTVREIVDVLSSQWNVRVEGSSHNMGVGTRYSNGKAISEHSYDEIMRMDLFEWQE